MKIKHLQVIAFDADDTLWINEPHFQHAEKQFCDLLEDYLPHHTVGRELLAMEIKNLPDYGYGVKSFTLSMIETALNISAKTLPLDAIERILEIGREMLHQPVDVLDGVEEVLQKLYGKYRLVMATKGDLLDQERKLERSGLAKYFHHTEIVSEKKESQYRKLVKHLDIEPNQFLMIGNSLKSDVLPVLNIGGYGVHVPFHTTWELERIDTKIAHDHFWQLDSIRGVLELV